MKTARPQHQSLQRQSPQHQSQNNPDFILLRAALAGLQDGFIVANQTGHIEKINDPAQRICDLLKTEADRLPLQIWSMCQSALKNQGVISFENIGIDAEIILPDIGTVRVRVHNICLAQTPYFLIILEDRQQTIRNKALSDAAIFGLTKRETEVWQLRLRGADYNEISTTLWISLNTVKKHVKNILAKRNSHETEFEFGLMA